MSILKSLLDIAAWLRDIDREIEFLKVEQRESNWLSRENLELAKKLRHELHELALLAGDLRVAMPLITEIRDAVVGEPVATVVLSVTHPSGGRMDLQVGKTKNLRFVAKGASGNPTTPKTLPVWQSSDTDNFRLDVAADSQTAVVTAIGAVGSENSVDVTVDGVESNVLVFDIVETPPPPPEDVASVELIAEDPAQAKRK